MLQSGRSRTGVMAKLIISEVSRILEAGGDAAKKLKLSKGRSSIVIVFSKTFGSSSFCSLQNCIAAEAFGISQARPITLSNCDVCCRFFARWPSQSNLQINPQIVSQTSGRFCLSEKKRPMASRDAWGQE